MIPDGYLLSSEPEWLARFASGLPERATMIELGTYKGKSAYYLGKGIQQVNGTLITVDIHLDYMNSDKFIGDHYIRSCYSNNLLGTIIPIIGDFYEVRKFFNMPIDALFIDGLHEYENVKKDFEEWSPLIKVGGFVLFHDVHNGFPGIQRFVGDIAQLKNDWENAGGSNSIKCFKKLR